jgi:short-subunit dehydrogenase
MNKDELKKQKGRMKTALITGATSGIGFQLAKLFAKDHFDLILVARHEGSLIETAEQLKKDGAGRISIIPKDLSVPGSAAEVYGETKALDIQVDILVNDAGVGLHGEFAENDLETELRIIQLNITSMVHLTKLYVRDMLTMNGGKILQLASIASYQPTPLLAVYAASKAFILSFSDALASELKDTGVTVTSLIPAATDTDFFNKAGMTNTKAAENLEDPAVVAKIGYEALMNGERHATAPGVKKEILMSSVSSNEKVASKAEKQMQEEKK